MFRQITSFRCVPDLDTLPTSPVDVGPRSPTRSTQSVMCVLIVVFITVTLTSDVEQATFALGRIGGPNWRVMQSPGALGREDSLFSRRILKILYCVLKISPLFQITSYSNRRSFSKINFSIVSLPMSGSVFGQSAELCEVLVVDLGFCVAKALSMAISQANTGT